MSEMILKACLLFSVYLVNNLRIKILIIDANLAICRAVKC